MSFVLQSWIILIVYITLIAMILGMSLFHKEYRKKVLRNSVSEILLSLLMILIMGFVMFYGAQCAVSGSNIMPSCSILSWFLTFIAILILIKSLVQNIALIAQ